MSTILDDARDAVFGDRQDDYGHPTKAFTRMARLWTAYLDEVDAKHLCVEDVAAMFILAKIARLIETPDHRDSLIDIAGYAENWARCVGEDLV